MINSKYLNICFRGDYKYLEIFGCKILRYTNPLRTYEKAKNIFKPLKKKFICNKTNHTPMMYWNDKYTIWASDVVWKDKWDSPRFEDHPCFLVNLFGYTFGWIWYPSAENTIDINDYWEQLLWYLFYYNTTSQGRLNSPDINKAKESWPWVGEDNKSTWKDEFLK